MDKLTISELDGESKTIESDGLVRLSFEIDGEEKHHFLAISTIEAGIRSLPWEKIYPTNQK
jgi:hypothetical protein